VSFPPFSADTLDILLRLVAAALVGMVIGLNRDFKGKPTEMRTLSLVSLGTAIVLVTALHYPGMAGHADALSRVLQGIIQGIIAGVGFIGAGVILHDEKTQRRPEPDDRRHRLGHRCARRRVRAHGVARRLDRRRSHLLILLSMPLERAAMRLHGARQTRGGKAVSPVMPSPRIQVHIP